MFAVARNWPLSHERRTRSAGSGCCEAGTAVLTDRNISALAADASGRLWVGYFDRGLDLLASDNSRARHVEDEHVFCVNRIFPDSKTGAIDVATANGLVRFDDSGSEQQVLTRADGLIADHVTDVVSYRDGLALATPAGLTFLDASGARSMYAFHGLVNNHVYALGVSGDELMAGHPRRPLAPRQGRRYRELHDGNLQPEAQLDYGGGPGRLRVDGGHLRRGCCRPRPLRTLPLLRESLPARSK